MQKINNIKTIHTAYLIPPPEHCYSLARCQIIPSLTRLVLGRIVRARARLDDGWMDVNGLGWGNTNGCRLFFVLQTQTKQNNCNKRTTLIPIAHYCIYLSCILSLFIPLNLSRGSIDGGVWQLLVVAKIGRSTNGQKVDGALSVDEARPWRWRRSNGLRPWTTLMS